MTTKEEEKFRADVEAILFGGPLSEDFGSRLEWLQSLHRRVKANAEAIKALQMVKANRACSSNACAMIADTVLTAPESAAAVEAYEREQEEHKELAALALTMRALFMYGATGYTSSIDDVYQAWSKHEIKLSRLAKVDARRAVQGGAK